MSYNVHITLNSYTHISPLPAAFAASLTRRSDHQRDSLSDRYSVQGLDSFVPRTGHYPSKSSPSFVEASYDSIVLKNVDGVAIHDTHNLSTEVGRV